MSVKMWAITVLDEIIGVYPTRMEAIGWVTYHPHYNKSHDESREDWKRLRRAGYRCVRVTVTVEAPAHE